MPKELVAIAPRTPVLRDHDEPPLGPSQLRIRTELASPKHGTELVGYRDDPVVSRAYDPAWGAMMPRSADTARRAFPRPRGNMAVGVVSEAGLDVSRFRVGDRVFGHLPIRETHTVDPLANRRDLAFTLGADVAIDPTGDDGDAGLAIRRLRRPPGGADPERRDPTPPKRLIGGYTEETTQHSPPLGVDVALETSGNIAALHGAIRFGGTIRVVSFYGRDAAGLHLDDEFHINQLRPISARSQSLPMCGAPAWTLERTVDLALRWMTSGRIRTNGILTPIVPFAKSGDAYRTIDEHPERSIKPGIRFSW